MVAQVRKLEGKWLHLSAIAVAGVLCATAGVQPLLSAAIALAFFLGVLGGVLKPIGLVLALTPVLVSSYALGLVLEGPDAAGMQKAAVILGVVYLILVLGVAKPPTPVLILLLFFCACLLITLVRLPLLTVVSAESAVRAYIGYVFAWLLFFVNWKKIGATNMMKVVLWLPIVAIGLGLFLQVAGVRPLFTHEYTGAIRLTAGLASAYMGSFGMFAVIAGMWLWLHNIRGSLAMSVVSLGLTLATGTRGASIVALVVMLIGVWFGKRSGKKVPGLTKFVAFLLATTAALVSLPLFIERTENQGESQGLLSGRELAWSFFWRRFTEYPWFGNGIGANSILGQTADSKIIQNSFIAPHNTYLQLLVDFGITGLIIGLIILLTIFRYVYLRSDAASRPLIVGLAMGLGFYAYFDNLLASPHPVTAMVVVLAALSLGPRDPVATLGNVTPVTTRTRTRLGSAQLQL